MSAGRAALHWRHCSEWVADIGCHHRAVLVLRPFHAQSATRTSHAEEQEEVAEDTQQNNLLTDTSEDQILSLIQALLRSPVSLS